MWSRTCFELAPILATARQARGQCARRRRTMTIPPEFTRHEWCLSAWGGRPRTARTCSGQWGSGHVALRNVSCRALADSLAGGTLYPVDRHSWLQTRASIGTGRFMVVGLRQLKLYKISLSAGRATRAISRAAGAPTRWIVAAPVWKATRGSSAARRIVVHAANRIDFSTVPGASRSCARDSADPLIRPCQARRRPRPSRASRCGQTVDEKKR